MEIQFSIIVPAYRVASRIEACLRSLLAQGREDMEILAVDDGSPDESGAICEAISAEDSRVITIHRENGGLSAARNTGLERARGRYVLFVDGDDALEPGALDRLAALLEAHGQPDIIQYRYREVDEAGHPLTADTFSESVRTTSLPEEKLRFLYILGGNGASACTKCIRRTLFDSLRFPEGLTHEDEYVTPGLLLASDTVVYYDAPLYRYIQSAGSLITSPFSPRKMDIFTVLHHRLAFLNENGYNEWIPHEHCRIARTAMQYYVAARHAGCREEARQCQRELRALPPDCFRRFPRIRRLLFWALYHTAIGWHLFYGYKSVLQLVGGPHGK